MRSIHDYFRSSIAQGLVLTTDDPDVFYTPARHRDAARREAGEEGGLRPIMGGSDFVFGSYGKLKSLKRREQRREPGVWDETDIHHVVENHHLQYLGRVHTVDDHTYERLEPCVLFVRSHHNLVLDGAIGVAEEYVLESKRFNFVQEFATAHREVKLSALDRGAMTKLKTRWLARVVAERRVTMREVREWLVEVYGEAYQEADMRPLREIAASVLRGMPV